MADVSHEPSMEEILSSIKKIISEDSGKSLSVPRRVRADAVPVTALCDEPEDVLELNDADIAAESSALPDIEPASVTPLISGGAEMASRNAFASLQTINVKTDRTPVTLGSQSVDDIVRDMLRPMLKDWLDTNLPAIVEGVVAKEVARISGR